MSEKVKVKENREFVLFWSVTAVAYLPTPESGQNSGSSSVLVSVTIFLTRV